MRREKKNSRTSDGQRIPLGIGKSLYAAHIHQETMMISMKDHSAIHIITTDSPETGLLINLLEAAIQFIRQAKLAFAIDDQEAKEENLLNSIAVLLEFRSCCRKIPDSDTSHRLIKHISLIMEEIIRSDRCNSIYSLNMVGSLLEELAAYVPEEPETGVCDQPSESCTSAEIACQVAV